MDSLPFMPDALAVRHLRTLTVDARAHPRGQPHISAASSLVCAHGRAYVISDDEHHLAVFRGPQAPGALHRMLPGDLPRSAKARKQMKPDLEALLLLSGTPGPHGQALAAFGSGSRPNRDTGVLVPLDAHGVPAEPARRFDLKPLYEPLRAELGEINIEGALLLGDELLLLHRGVNARSENAIVRYRRHELLAVIEGRRHQVRPRALQISRLGSIDGVALGYTDGTALDAHTWVFCAAAEDTGDSYADGPSRGTALGLADADGRLLALHRLDTPLKVEGIAARRHARGLDICLVTDADDPAQSSQLLLAQL